MNADVRRTALEVLEWLVATDPLRPRRDVEAEFTELRDRHPGHAMNLLWQHEAYDGSVHYDVLIELANRGTISLSFCHDRALPWPLRGVRRWSDQDLLRVNNTVLKVQQAMAYLDFLWDDRELMARLVDACLMKEALDEAPVEISADDLQRTMDGFRASRGLFSRASTEEWLSRHGMTHRLLERLLEGEAQVRKLKERVVRRQVIPYYEAHREEFETCGGVAADFPTQELADEAMRVCQARPDRIYGATETTFVTAARSGSRAPSLRFQTVRRGSARDPAVEAIFRANPHDLVGPFAVEHGWRIFRVLFRSAPTLDQEVRSWIEETLFHIWLESRRRGARIDWLWGPAD